jgi:LacI family transcriptional regulator
LEIGEKQDLKFRHLPNFIITDPTMYLFKNRKTKTIGIIIQIVHYFSPLINGIEQVANENGYSVIICLSDDSFEKRSVTWKC